MSDTPRTDAIIDKHMGFAFGHKINYRELGDLCRQLEKELAEEKSLNALQFKLLQEKKNTVAARMIKMGFSTGHGDTMDQLLDELEVQVKEMKRTHVAIHTRTLWLRNEVNCRIEHGASGPGHLEYVQKVLDLILAVMSPQKDPAQ